MKIITIANQKGGVAKTTTAFNMAAALSQKHDKKVLLIDLDPQGNLSEYLGHEDEENGLTIADVIDTFISKSFVDEKLAEKSIFTNDKNGVDYIPADLSLANTEQMMQNVLSRETVLKRILYSLQLFHDYDFILIDTLPSLGILMLNALAASDGVIIPSQTQKFSADGLEALLSVIEQVRTALNNDLELYGILPTMVDNTIISKTTEEDFRNAYADKMFGASIHRSVEAARSSVTGYALFKRKTRIGDDYLAFAKEFIEKYGG